MTIRRPSTSNWRALLTSWALLFALTATWAIATPISAAPDEPAHLVKAASVVRGQFIGDPGEFGEVVSVPRYIAHTHAETCYAFHVDESADCVPADSGDPSELVEATTTAGLYNPLYYVLIGWPSLVFGDSTGVYAMRMMSALLTSGLLALSFMIVAGWRRRVLPALGLLTALTPMVIFLGGVVNPSGPEIAGSLAASVAVVSIALGRDKSRLAQQSAVLAIGAAVAVNMRGISPLWVAIGLAAPLLLLGWNSLRELLRTAAVRTAVAVVLAAAALAMVWTVFSNSLGSGIDGDGAEQLYPGVGTHPVVGFVQMLLSTFDYGRGIVGEFGWTEISAPPYAFFLWSALTGALLVFGASILRGRHLIVYGIVLGAAFLLPAAVQAVYVTSGGYIWQGRYTLPAFAILVFVTAALLDEVLGERLEGRSAGRLLAVVAAAWAFAQFDSFLRVLRRYAEGWPSSWGEFLRTPDWAPPGGTIALPIAFAVLVALFAYWVHRAERPSAELRSNSETLATIPSP